MKGIEEPISWSFHDMEYLPRFQETFLLIDRVVKVQVREVSVGFIFTRDTKFFFFRKTYVGGGRLGTREQEKDWNLRVADVYYSFISSCLLCENTRTGRREEDKD